MNRVHESNSIKNATERAQSRRHGYMEEKPNLQSDSEDTTHNLTLEQLIELLHPTL